MQKRYNVRVYFTKFVDIEVEAEDADEAVTIYEVPHLDWFDKHDTSIDEYSTEVEEIDY